MKRLLFALLVIFSINEAFSGPGTDFFIANANIVLAAISFIIVFGASIGVSSLWVNRSNEGILISLGISLLVSLLIILNSGILSILYSIISYSPIFLVAFALIALFLNMFMAKENWAKGLSAAALGASIFLIFFITDGFSINTSSGGSVSSQGNPAALIIIMSILAIGAIIFIVIKFKDKVADSFSSRESVAGSSPSPVTRQFNGACVIKGKLLGFGIDGKINKMKNQTVTLIGKKKSDNSAVSINSLPTSSSGEFKIIVPEPVKEAYLQYKAGAKISTHKMIFGIGPYGKREDFETFQNKLMPNLIVPALHDDIYNNIQEDSYMNFEKIMLKNLKNYENFLEELDQFLLNCIKIRMISPAAEIDSTTTPPMNIFQKSDNVNSGYWADFFSNIIAIFNNLGIFKKKKFLKTFWQFILAFNGLSYNPTTNPTYSFKENVKSAKNYENAFNDLENDLSFAATILGGTP